MYITKIAFIGNRDQNFILVG